MTRIIGIDLGTTNSCVAVFDRGVPTVLASPEGERTTPSMVTFHPDGRVLVGAAARRHAVTQARRSVQGAKRLIGRKVNAPDVVRLAKAVPFQLVAAPNGDAWIRLDEQQDVSPQEVAAFVLERMRTIAEIALGEPVTQAVITVPAYFNDVQRQATKDAGRIAGLDVRRILNEPTAAALAYGVHRRKDKQRLAVFDLGGGTFDVSILHVEAGVFEVLAVNGDAALGGDDFDRRIVDQLILELSAEGAVDVAGDPIALGRLKEEAERAKRALSDEPETIMSMPFAGRKASGEPVHLERSLRRRELESLTAELVARLEAPCAAALRDAGLTRGGLDDVLLVGGMTRMPAVQQAVERIFGRRPSKGAHPDEVVAIGAAAHAALLTSERDDLVLLDVIPHSLGVRVGDTVSVVIPRNTIVPTRARKTFATTQDGQSAVTVEIYQGDAPQLGGNRHLGRFTFEGLPPAPAGQVRVELTFAVDADGIVTLDAREPTTGRMAQHTLAPSGGLEAGELERIIERRRAARATAP